MKKKTEMYSSCNTAEDLKLFLKEKATAHNSYKHYAPIERIKQIVEAKKLYLTNGANWNDITDRNNFSNAYSNSVNFGKCFSYAVDESVAMWMLYCETPNTNAMIDFTRFGINNILNIQKITLGFFDKNKFVSISTVQKPDFDIYLIDIVYHNKKRKYIKHSSESCYKIDSQIIENLGVCGKTYSWSYEKECRLIVSINMDKVPINCCALEIDLNGLNLGKSFDRVYYCPNYIGEEVCGFKKSELEGETDFNYKKQ